MRQQLPLNKPIVFQSHNTHSQKRRIWQVTFINKKQQMEIVLQGARCKELWF